MKLIKLFSALLFITIASNTWAQSPNKFSYQAVIRDASNQLLQTAPVGMQISILQGSSTGTAVYVETHSGTTNLNGLVSVQIGGGTIVSGDMSTIDWGNGPYFIEVATDPDGGSNYSITATQELLSVPFAMYAMNGGVAGPQGPEGPEGPMGMTGPEGPQGPQGPEGPEGPIGPSGPQGPEGPMGMTGAQGPIGLTGPAGPQGPQGPAGNDGADGATGPQGPIGLTGPAGPQGPAGNDGADGATGPQGPIGLTGPAGPQGPQGPQGPAGNDGADGATGPQGPQGIAGPIGPQGPAGPIAGSNTHVIYNDNGAAGGTSAFTFDETNSVLSVAGAITTPNASITALGGGGTRYVQVNNSGLLSATTAAGITGTGTNNFLTKWTTAGSVVGNSQIQDNGTSIGINISPLAQYGVYVYRQQLGVNGDGQNSLFGYRTRDAQNDGTGYAQSVVNSATGGYNFWGDVYTFGVSGHNYNDYTRTGGVLGAEVSGNYWGSLGYRSSGLVNYGVYGSSAYANGGGFAPSASVAGVGGGFFGDFIGSLSKGDIIGQINSGELFAAYNDGDTYTKGQNIELAETANGMTPLFASTSTEANVYSKGKAQLNNGTVFVAFDANYTALIGEAPVVTVSPNGECNGVFIQSVSKEGFYVKELSNGTSNASISWIAVGTRSAASAQEKALEIVSSPSFDRNIQQVLYSDGNLEGSAQGMWWDGTTIQFGKIPEGLNKAPRK